MYCYGIRITASLPHDTIKLLPFYFHMPAKRRREQWEYKNMPDNSRYINGLTSAYPESQQWRADPTVREPSCLDGWTFLPARGTLAPTGTIFTTITCARKHTHTTYTEHTQNTHPHTHTSYTVYTNVCYTCHTIYTTHKHTIKNKNLFKIPTSSNFYLANSMENKRNINWDPPPLLNLK